MIAATILGTAFPLLLGLEALYFWWLPPERPVRASRPLPASVRNAIWAEFGGRGCPRLDPQIPFLIPILIPNLLSTSLTEPSPQHSLLFMVSRTALRRPMRQFEFSARSIALATWISRHWTIEDAIDSVGSQVWMDSAGNGFEAGARYYWHRPLDGLAVHEVATLLAVMQSPRGLDPACWPERALSGRARALEKMRDAGVIDENAFRQAMAAPMHVVPACDRPLEAPLGRAQTRASPCHP